jgi:type IV secretory pathway VirB10-like protein
MASNRVVTSLAIAFGGLLGSVAALVGGAPEPAAPRPPAAFAPISRGPAAQSQPPLRPERPVPPPPTLPAATSAMAQPVPKPEPPPTAPTGAQAVRQAELECARGTGRSCLDAAEAYEEARGVGADPERARMLTGLGVQQFAVRCMQRVPSGCLELAKLHSSGRGVARDQRAADALVDRATMLCRARPGAQGCPGTE